MPGEKAETSKSSSGGEFLWARVQAKFTQAQSPGTPAPAKLHRRETPAPAKTTS
jgi:hypothetical protein